MCDGIVTKERLFGYATLLAPHSNQGVSSLARVRAVHRERAAGRRSRSGEARASVTTTSAPSTSCSASCASVDGVAAQVLAASTSPRRSVRDEIVRIVGRGGGSTPGQIPFTPRAKKVLELVAARGALARPQRHRHRAHPARPRRARTAASRRASSKASGSDAERVRASIAVDARDRPGEHSQRPIEPATASARGDWAGQGSEADTRPGSTASRRAASSSRPTGSTSSAPTAGSSSACVRKRSRARGSIFKRRRDSSGRDLRAAG